MEAETLIELAYREFSCFEKPEHSTNYNHCLECAEYDELLYNVSRENLSIQQIGTELWGPVAFLVPEALAYYLPRLIKKIRGQVYIRSIVPLIWIIDPARICLNSLSASLAALASFAD